jgi:hypothetical protein
VIFGFRDDLLLASGLPDMECNTLAERK